MEYRIYQIPDFEKDFQKLSPPDRARVRKIIEQLKANPFTGKPLGYRFFREKKFDGKRLYYLIYEQVLVTLLVAISGKSDQQATIEAIKALFQQYKDEISKLNQLK